jgi:hypothetical protein
MLVLKFQPQHFYDLCCVFGTPFDVARCVWFENIA